MCHLLWGLIATVSANQTWIICLSTIKECHIVKPTIGVSLQDELFKLHQDYLVRKQKQKYDFKWSLVVFLVGCVKTLENNMFCMLGVSALQTISGSTVISQEQLVPGGYFLSGQLGVMISPWAFVIFPPQNCWSETSRTHSMRTMKEDNSRLYSQSLILK